jgi:DNA-binding MarR family transcriptional regulator
MPRRRPASAPAAAAGLADSVDRIVAEWTAQRPDLPVAPIEVLTRLARVRTRMDEELAAVFSRYDLSAADFTVIAALCRAGAPYTLPQNVLMARLGLTSGTVSVRLGRLETKGVVTRAPSSTDSRGVLVTLTPKGVDLFDQVAPTHLANEDVLLSALTTDERDQLAGLLRKLLIAFEHETTHHPAGFSVAPAHVARRARTAVGLSDRTGLLVQHVDTAGLAETAGLQPGDLLVTAAGRPLASCVDLADASAAARSARTPLRLGVVRGEQDREVDLDPA